MDSSLIVRLDFRVEFEKMQSEIAALIEKVGWDEKSNQIGLTHTENCPADWRYFESVGSLYDYEKDCFLHQEGDFHCLHSDLKGSYLEWVYKNVPFRPARVRVMKLDTKKCLSLHEDTGPRYHFAVQTNPGALMVFPNEKQALHIPADGWLYRMEATRPHTAINSDKTQARIHLVFSDRDRH